MKIAAAGLNKTVVARNLPTTATKENLKTTFEEFGSVSNVHIVANSPLAFIEFSDPSSAQAVLLRAKTSAVCCLLLFLFFMVDH